MKHAHVEATLVQAESGRRQPDAGCLLPVADPEPLDQPTRLACIVTETACGVSVEEFDLLALLRPAGSEHRVAAHQQGATTP